MLERQVSGEKKGRERREPPPRCRQNEDHEER
jgi:hypothetical protein